MRHVREVGALDRTRTGSATTGGVHEELATILRRDPTLAELVEPQPGEPEQPRFEVLWRGPIPYAAVRVPVPGRSGTLRVSRLPGFHRTQTRQEVAALEEAGIDRIVCLVPEEALLRIHHAHRYLDLARRRFGDRFGVVPIDDHRVPQGDALFERRVDEVDRALREGESVLVHCLGGCGRSGVFVACVLARGGMGGAEAIRHFRAHRRCGPETAAQVAYVFRYVARRSPSARVLDETEVRVRLARGSDGKPRLLARGGLARVYAGRLVFGTGKRRRVAIKHFGVPISEQQARQMTETIEALRAAGVRLPRMAMVRTDDGNWVQVSPLFGSTGGGSKLDQQSLYYRALDADQRAFLIEQLARVANAGHVPSLDLFLVFRERGDVIPLDLDLVVPEPDVARRATKLVICVVQVGCDGNDRDRLLAVARRAAHAELREGMDALLERERARYEVYWGL
ncbi:MAG: protein-tyrosine phosphatase family protein [Myxococcota bacterium]